MVGMIKCLIPLISGPIFYETIKKKMSEASGRKGGQ